MKGHVMESAYKDGKEAFLHGMKENECPYPPHPGTRNRRLQWLRGWHDADDYAASKS